MKIKLIDFGGRAPERAHYNDAGADVFTNKRTIIWPNSIAKIGLGFGLELPDGLVAFVCPRSGLSANRGITTEMVPVDSGYRGEIHAIVYNANDAKTIIEKGTKIAQLVIMPIILAEFHNGELAERKDKGFGSTGNG